MNITSLMTDSEHRLVKRAEELYSRAQNGSPAYLQFLNPRERYIIEHRLGAIFSQDESEPVCFFDGGYPSAVRTILFMLPAYERYSMGENESPSSAFFDEIREQIATLHIKTGGYVKLSHRDFLGALIGLGIERSAMGDIVLTDDGAVIFVLPSVAELIKTQLTYVGRDKVKVSDITLPRDFDSKPKFENIRGTVASARLDAVLSEIVCCSRETAKTAVMQGLVEHNHFTAAKPDTEVVSGDIISARKSAGIKGGKFIIDSIDERSSKGRIRLAARRYT